MERAYIAAPIFNKEQLAVVTSITLMLKMQEWKYFSPYEASRSVWKGRAPKDCTQAERDAVLNGNITNLDWAEVLLAWVGGTEDGRTDTGVIWEMGHFDALRRYVDINNPNEVPNAAVSQRFVLAYISPTDKRQNMNLMLAGTVDAVAFGPAQLHEAMNILRHPIISPSRIREKFHPDKQIQHEKEQIS